MGRFKRSTLAAFGVALVVMLAAACGSSSSSKSSSGGSSSSARGRADRGSDDWTGADGALDRERGQGRGRDRVLHRGPRRNAELHLPDVHVRGLQHDERQPADEHAVLPALHVRRRTTSPTIDYSHSIGQAPRHVQRRQDVHDQAEPVEVVQRRARDRARSRVLDERPEGQPVDGVVRLRARLLPRQRDELLGPESIDVRASPSTRRTTPSGCSTASSRRSSRCRWHGTGRRCRSRRRRPITGICRTRRRPARRPSTSSSTPSRRSSPTGPARRCGAWWTGR